MCKNNPTIHYCTILSAVQWNFLLDGKSTIDRQKCLHRLMTTAVMAKTHLHIKGVEVALEVGQVAMSDVELAAYMGCNRKTIGKLIDGFNRLGMLTTLTNNRTSVHTLHFLTGWYVDGVLLTNPHYVRPSASAQGQTSTERTPHLDGTPPVDGRRAKTDVNRTVGQGADSMGKEILPSLSLPDAHIRSQPDRPSGHQAVHTHSIDNNAVHPSDGRNDASCVAQDAGIDSEAGSVSGPSG